MGRSLSVEIIYGTPLTEGWDDELDVSIVEWEVGLAIKAGHKSPWDSPEWQDLSYDELKALPDFREKADAWSDILETIKNDYGVDVTHGGLTGEWGVPFAYVTETRLRNYELALKFDPEDLADGLGHLAKWNEQISKWLEDTGNDAELMKNVGWYAISSYG